MNLFFSFFYNKSCILTKSFGEKRNYVINSLVVHTVLFIQFCFCLFSSVMLSFVVCFVMLLVLNIPLFFQ